MLSQRDKSVIINILDEVLGVGTSLRGNEQAHHCPFCHHHKKKLQVNLETQQWHCWVCDSKGRKIQTLLRRLHVDSKKIKKVYEIYGDDYIVSATPTDEEKVELRLPSEFKSLLVEPKGLNPLYRKVVQYAKDRGITKEDIIRYNIGYCDGGIYTNRITIEIIDSITSSHGLYSLRKNLSIKIRRYRRMLRCLKIKSIGKNLLHFVKEFLMR